MPAKRAFVNLLPQTEFETSLWGKLLKWSLSTGRYLIILTEMVVIVAFLSRFKLDKDLSDLSDSLNGKKAILQAQSEFESDFRKLQNRLNSAGQIVKNQLPASATLDQVTQTVPDGMRIINLSLQNTDLALTAQAPDLAFRTFVNEFSKNRKFKNVSISNINYDPVSGVKFILTANY